MSGGASGTSGAAMAKPAPAASSGAGAGAGAAPKPAPAPAPAAPAEAGAPAAKKLPKTGSDLPLLGMSGAALLALAMMLTMVRRRNVRL